MGSRNSRTIGIVVLISFLSLFFPAASTVPNEQIGEEILSKFYSLQIPFIENRGQVKNTNVTYYAKTLGAGFFISKDGQIFYSLSTIENDGEIKGWIIEESLSGTSILGVKGEEKSTANLTEFKGKDPLAWKADLPSHDQVNFGEVYSGIELSLKAYGGGLEKLFYVKAKAAPEGIGVRVEGAKSLIPLNSISSSLRILRFWGTIFSPTTSYKAFSFIRETK